MPLQLWPFSSAARAARADRKAREREAEQYKADARWEVLCMTGGTAVRGSEAALGRDRRSTASHSSSRGHAASTSYKPPVSYAKTSTPRNSRPPVALGRGKKQWGDKAAALRRVKTY